MSTADETDLPELLVRPPWTRRARPEVRTDLTAPPDLVLRWLPGEREAWAETVWEQAEEWWAETEWAGLDAATRESVVDWPTALTGGLTETGPFGGRPIEFLAEAPPEHALPLLDLAERFPYPHWFELEPVQRILARCGDGAVGFAVRLALARPTPLAPVLLPIAGAEVAVAMAGWLGRAPDWRDLLACEWFARHPLAAARGLVPVALGPTGRARDAAETALRLLAESEEHEAVRVAAAGYGPDVADAVQALVDVDPLRRLPDKLPTRPAWLDPAQLPPVLLAGRDAVLPVEAVGHVCTALALCGVNGTYPGVAVIKAATDPDSLAGLAWALFERWRDAGYPGRERWILRAQVLCGNDDTCRRLAPLVRAWTLKMPTKVRAYTALEVFTAVGSDLALMHLHSMATHARKEGLRERAGQRLAAVAAERGWSGTELADRLVPDLDLDRDGRMVLDYGPRRFIVGFDEMLRPIVADEGGKPRKALPKPGVKDDPVLAPAAHAAFAGLRKDVRTVAGDQLRRLERAMVDRRRWTAAQWRARLVEHPLMWHLTRRLVWATYAEDGALLEAFRVAEDRTPADVEDTGLTLADDARVGIAHPLHLGERLPAWSELFADYELLQPFPQLGRGRPAPLTPVERQAAVLRRLDGVELSAGDLLGMSRYGWERGPVGDGGAWYSLDKPIGGSRTLVIDVEPGVHITEPAAAGEQTVTGVRIQGPNWPADLPFSALDDVEAFELLRDLDLLRG